MWFLPAQFYVTSIYNGEAVAGGNYLGFFLDVRRLQEAITRGEVEVYKTSDDEEYVAIRGDWEELSESKKSRLDIEDNAFRPLVGYIRTTQWTPEYSEIDIETARFKVSLNLNQINRSGGLENTDGKTLIIAGRRGDFDRIRRGERAVGTLRIIATTDYPINPAVTINYPRGI